MKEENIFIRQLKKHPLSFLYRLIKNIVFALFFFCLVLVLLYIVGNYQSFQFESQILILRAISFSSIALFIFSILILFETVIRFATKGEKVKSLIVILIMLFNIIFCIVCATKIRRIIPVPSLTLRPVQTLFRREKILTHVLPVVHHCFVLSIFRYIRFKIYQKP